MITTSLKFTQLDPVSYRSLLEDKKGTIIDTRTPSEYAEYHLPHAINIDFYSLDFDRQIDVLDRELPYFIYCRTGSRSSVILEMMKKQGFKEVYDLKGGIIAWEVSNYQT